MGSTLAKGIHQIFIIFIMGFHTVVKYLFIDLRLLFGSMKTRHRFQENNGISEKCIGPPFLRRYLVEISPESPELGHKQLEFLMDLNEPQSRHPFSVVNAVSGSNFFLSMSNENGAHLRQILSRCLVPGVFYKELTISVDTLITELKTKNNNTDRVDEIIDQHIFRFFVKTIFGVDLANEMYKVLMELEKALKSTMPQLRLYISDKIMDQLPYIKDRNQHIIKLITQFLIQVIKNIEVNDIRLSERNFLHLILKEKLQKLDKTIHQLNVNDIKHLAEDKDIRVCISGLIATRPLQTAVKQALEYLYYPANSYKTITFRDFLLKELHENPLNNSAAELNNKQKRPILEALCLETLRLSVPTNVITRYTRSGILNDSLKLTIPPESLVVFHLNKLVKMGGDAFNIRRYLKEDGSFADNVGLHHGSLTPFGLGSRKCPAALVSMIILKTYLVTFAKQIRTWHGGEEIEFEDNIPQEMTSVLLSETQGTLFNAANRKSLPLTESIHSLQDEIKKVNGF